MAERSAATNGGKKLAQADPDRIRNVILVGESGSGKTTIIEALLVAAGAIGRAGKIEDGTTVSDHDEIEQRQNRSVGLSLASFMYGKTKINLLDAPGYADYVGELRAGLRAADGVIFVVSAIDGVGGATRLLWQECDAVLAPRAVLVTKLDSPRADFDRVAAECHEAFGAGVLPLMLPVYGARDEVTALMGLLTGEIHDYTTDTRVDRAPNDDESGRLRRNRDALVEAIITESDDEILLDTYLEGGELDGTRLLADLEEAVSRAGFFPMLPMAAPGGIGTIELLELIDRGFPAPTHARIPEIRDSEENTLTGITTDPDGPLYAQVVKTMTDTYVGRISLVRVFSGTLRQDDELTVAPTFARLSADEDEIVRNHETRAGALSTLLGNKSIKINQCVAGDICAIAKLSDVDTGDTLAAPDDSHYIVPWSLPEPLLPVAIIAKTSADEDKLGIGLARLVAEDPTLLLEHDRRTSQLVLWCMGESHADVAFERLREKFGVEVERIPYRVALLETVAKSATAKGRHVKQSGGHGQYAVCDVKIEPLAPGSGFEFVDKVVGGAVPRQFIPSVEKGLRAQLEKGVSTGYPMVDIRATLFDGKSHSVDSSDVAFQQAGAAALREAAEAAGVTMLEPIVKLTVLVDDEYVGSVMADLSTKRGRISGTDSLPGHRAVITAEVPEIELIRYAIDLRSIARGAGSFTRESLGYEPMPAALVDQAISQTS